MSQFHHMKTSEALAFTIGGCLGGGIQRVAIVVTTTAHIDALMQDISALSVVWGFHAQVSFRRTCPSVLFSSKAEVRFFYIRDSDLIRGREFQVGWGHCLHQSADTERDNCERILERYTRLPLADGRPRLFMTS